MSDRTILIVEDEPKFSRLLTEYLRLAGFATHVIEDGRAVLPWLRANPVDLMLLDLMLPGKDGLEICRELRGFSNLPVIIATARVEEIDRLLGLESGADDYICKPYSPREVVARVKAVLRRQAQPDLPEATNHALRLDEASHRITDGKTTVELTDIEFHLMRVLMARPGQIFARQHLMDLIYHDHRVVSDRTIDSHVKKLRRKLNGLVPDREVVHSVYGVGYRYEYEPDDI